jgi:hypothetical protein
MNATRRLTVTALRELRSGTSSGGRPWVLHQVQARDPAGELIEQNLVTFERLPLNELIEVEIKRRDDPKFGVSYSLKRPRADGGLAGRVEALERRMTAIERRLAGGS